MTTVRASISTSNQAPTAARPCARRRWGFSLVELMVVIGIIGLLLALLVPALHTASEQAKTVQCLSNLRQVMLATQIYIEQNKGTFPLATYTATHGTQKFTYNWDFTTIFDTSNSTTTMIPGLIWSAKTNLRIQQCPSYDGPSMTAAGAYTGDPYTGYNYNTSYIGSEYISAISQFTPSTKTVQIRKPAETVIFGDGAYRVGTNKLGANKFMRAPLTDAQANDAYWSASYRYAGTQAYRHLKKTNVVYADGHAVTIKERYNPDTRDVASQTGFLSADNSAYDLK